MPTLPLAFDPGGAFDPFLLLLTALVLDAYLGEMRLLFKVVPHPIAAIGSVIGWFERRLNRPERSPVARRVRGVLVVIVLTGAALGSGAHDPGSGGLDALWLGAGVVCSGHAGRAA